jgi:hypothetical protein
MHVMCTLGGPSATLVEGAASESDLRAIGCALARFGDGALRFAARFGIRIVPLRAGQRYRDVSGVLRRLGVDVDAWPVPPAGLFVVEERAVFLRSASPMTVAHEFGHALDCALGAGVYRSGYDARVRAAFSAARTYVTPYAATGLDEYFAESLRAFVEVNDAQSPWPRATRARLRAVDPAMCDFVAGLFDELTQVPGGL